MLKKLGTIAFALSLVGFGVLGYLELSARLSQRQMRSEWGDIEKGGRRDRSSERREGSGRGGFEELKVERRGSEKNQLGILSVPKIGLEQVVLFDSTVENLKHAPSLIKETAFPGTRGNAVIAGHRTTYGFPFKRIDELNKGDKIVFKNQSGKATYRVIKKFRVRPNDRSVLKQTKGARISLLSCDPPLSSAYRLIIVGAAVK